jgi:hypothetical protein
MAEII